MSDWVRVDPFEDAFFDQVLAEALGSVRMQLAEADAPAAVIVRAEQVVRHKHAQELAKLRRRLAH